MAKPVVLVVDDEADSLRALTQELESRYGAHYRIVARASATDALATLAELRAEDAAVPLVLADQWMPGTTGIELLARTRELHPTARRGLLISWGDRSATAPILAAAALGQIEFYLPKPAWSPDEEFHLALTASLGEWWRQQGGGRFEAVTVIGAEHHARSHEIRDLLTRNSVPFGFHRADSAEGLAALRRLGLRADLGPVVALYSGTVLVDPTNAEFGAALGVAVRPPEQSYDLLIVGAGPAGLAAAVYGASEGLRTAVLEREAFGGQAGTSSLIRNYPGFPWGVSGGGDGRLDHLRLRDRFSGGVDSLPAAGLFVLIGAEPFTEWLPDRLGRDRWGYVLTGADAGEPWPLERAPLPLETTMPGVFVVGDVRHGSVKRVASAVGEGSMCIHQVHQYLALP